ncbi:GTP cyclohydrolase II [Gallaecimonas kandeliae]|uniref:GTP cyclohydrolase II n=1 Tax=Gallaecimonas kandeliae TaxID=3029055 RepID=UPI002648B081|nr:GTP cyclohydrolase II [Gallaecimonas kandeliae]WKE66823.1 GTP cyclohydrolase II [Gallaecimonas kandeliae]
MTADAGNNAVTVRRKVEIPVLGGRYLATFITFDNLPDGKEHFALALGDWQRDKPLVRMHSECVTGDVFLSARCDCGPQLEEAIVRISAEGGVILYLRQEGRGIGLINKLDAYAKQDEGLNTYEANRALGFEDDQRDFGVAALMLKALGLDHIRLLTNNPRKIEQLESHGIHVDERVGTRVYRNDHNERYLAAKKEEGRHALGGDDDCCPFHSKY